MPEGILYFMRWTDIALPHEYVISKTERGKIMKTTYFTLTCRVVVAALFLVVSNAMAGGGTLQNMGNGICNDPVSGLMWQIAKGKRFSSFNEVTNYIAGLKLGGYTDWRLPTTLESSELRGLIAIQGNKDCNIPKLESTYWLVDNKKGAVPAKLELECFCRGDFDLVVKDKGYARVVRSAKTPALDKH